MSLSDSPQSALNRLEDEFPARAVTTDDRRRHFCLAAALLHAQNRVDDVITAANGLSALQHHELIWTALYHHLKRCGYTLDGRYRPGWRPAAAGTAHKRLLHLVREKASAMLFGPARDGTPLRPEEFRTMRATSRSTGARVYLKIIASSPTDPHGQERDILELLNSEPHRSHPDNPCVPVHEFLSFPEVPDADKPSSHSLSIAVMPVLQPLRHRRFSIIKALYLDVIEQSVRGLAYLHSMGIAHMDLCHSNLAMSDGNAPFRVYFLDFGLARQFLDLRRPVRVVWPGGRIQPPEVRQNRLKPYDPFKADLYVLAREFLELNFVYNPELSAVARVMSSQKPEERSTAAEALEIMHYTLASRSWWYFARLGPLGRRLRHPVQYLHALWCLSVNCCDIRITLFNTPSCCVPALILHNVIVGANADILGSGSLGCVDHNAFLLVDLFIVSKLLSTPA
ncbi:hypothetical protein EXIGLDRAFT_830242 [Exidia glandulosa HHB12029]|uniref:Protein kinase domain-containing protein n=1 Tax=Exidia glandulosa HHB12029 TaxID=1314781 RepID=A0A165NVT3_EXIGL|nr:hypothetical protein EXIGLDRAFT_830242 [Exidia glandulosa HHB12029]